MEGSAQKRKAIALDDVGEEGCQDEGACAGGSGGGGDGLPSNADNAGVMRAAGAATAFSSLLPAEKTQIAIMPEDEVVDQKLFPQDVVDVNGQQVDLRDRNTWISTLTEVQTPEVTEVFAINTISVSPRGRRPLIHLVAFVHAGL